VVDDDPTMRELIAVYLADHGFRASAVEGGQGMARTLYEHPVDLIVLDLKLGEEDRLQLVKALRARSNLPIIVITGVTGVTKWTTSSASSLGLTTT
jgi:two-component system OmpR family response regulator